MVALAAVAAIGWLGCGSDEAGGGGAGAAASTTSTSGAGGSAVDGGSGGEGATGSGGSSCDGAAFVPVAQDAGPYLGAFVYLAQDTLAAPVDVLTFELLAGAPAVGSLPISSAGYDSCSNCVLLYRDCDDALANCAKKFIAQAGRIEVASTGETGDTFAGTLHEAAFVEVPIDGQGVTTPVSGGEQYCQAPYAFSVVIQ
jgi:hypothetical protein